MLRGTYCTKPGSRYDNECSGPIDISTDPSAARRYMQASAQWETMTEELDLIPLTEDELNLRINPITPGVLAVLDAAGLIIPETDEAQSPRPTLVRG